jgi:hypothetical protein
MISYDYWQTHLSGHQPLSGMKLRVNGVPLSIVGVAPEHFQGTIVGLNFDLWIPATMAPAVLAGSKELDDRSLRGYSVVGDLAPGRSLKDATGGLAAAMRQLADTYPDTNRAVRGVLPFRRRADPSMPPPAIVILQPPWCCAAGGLREYREPHVVARRHEARR